MKHTLSRKGAALAGTAGLVAVVAIWPTVAGADSHGQRGGTVVVGPFTSDRIEEAFIDNGSRGPSLGDVLVFTNSVDGPFGAATEYGSCVLHDVDLTAGAATFNCTTTSKGRGGSVTFQGSARTTLVVAPATPRLLEPASYAITGGSGRFLRARGDVRITNFEGSGPGSRTSGRVRVVLTP